MGKSIFSISIDNEIATELDKEENKSELINNLLKNYYNDKNFKEKSLVDKLKEIEILENDVSIEKQKELQKINEEIDKMNDVKNKLIIEQKNEFEHIVNLLETRQDLSSEFLIEIKKDLSKIDDMNFLEPFLNKFRLAGLKVGFRQLKEYAKIKLDENYIEDKLKNIE